MQAWEYGEAKKARGDWLSDRVVFAENGRTAGIAQVLIKKYPMVGHALAWVNRGPLCLGGAEDSAATASMLDLLRERYVESQGAYLRVAPPLNGNLGNPVSFTVAGFYPSPRAGWSSAILDLTQPEDAIRAGLSKKWRNSLVKAEKQDLQLEYRDDSARFEEFIGEYRRFLERKAFPTRVTPGLLRELGKAAGIPPVVISARKGSAVLGSVLIVRYGVTSEYLAGVMEEEGRGLNVGQLLLWRAVVEMKRSCLKFDLGGMDPLDTGSGISRFKAGLGGIHYRYVNEIESDGSFVSKMMRFVCQCVGT
jgi:hypothetical protein